MYQEYINLLEAFRLSLMAEIDSEVNKIVEQINETVANLKTGKYRAVALTSQLFDVVSLVGNLMAFNDLKLNAFQSKVWNKLRDATYQRYTKDGNFLNFLNHYQHEKRESELWILFFNALKRKRPMLGSA
ncbi:hypothetical protein [Lactobacillus taiwanensis]|uniref:hypothetical protein n=1 Tax=Lactobacillus taiwanensis TaxID=508451 RepID=UPI002697155D